MKKLILGFLFFSSFSIFAASIDMSGAMRVDTTRIQNYRKTDTNTTSITDGHIIKGDDENAIINTYIFRLNPEMIINDHVTVKAELSTGHPRGGVIGQDISSIQNQSTNFDAQFFHTSPSGNSPVNFNQYFMEVYSDLATYKIGKFSKHWGLGAVYNNGSNPNDRFATTLEGLEANFSLGKIFITPYWARIGGSGSFTHAAQSREMGVSALYDNPDNDQQLGILWSHRKSGSNDGLYVRNGVDLETSFSLIDFYYRKIWDSISVAIEVPYIDGTIKNGGLNSLKPSAYLAEIGYEASDRFNLTLHGGYVSGDLDNDSELQAMYLNPNYRISHLMFRYNLDAVENPASGNIFDAAINNASYAKLAGTYSTGIWDWTLSALWAQANETITGQGSDLGYEVSLDFKYLWNPKLSIDGFLSYHIVGKYYEFSSSGTIATKNPIGGGLSASLKF